MAALASTLDVENRWRPLSSTEAATASALLEDASAMIRLRVTNIDARIATDTNLAALARHVVSAMVLRVLRNPEGKRSESIDDYSYTRDNSVSGGALYVTDEEVASLSGASAAAFTIRPYGEPMTSELSSWA